MSGMEHTIPEATSPRRRRSHGFVTQNACTECRRKRAKCDGQKPCSACAARNILQCVYEVPTRVSKEHMRKEIEHLKEQTDIRETVIDALAKNESSEPVLQQLKDKVPLTEIADQIYKSFPSLRSRPLPTREETMSSETDHDSYEVRAPEHWTSDSRNKRSTMQQWKGASYFLRSQESIDEENFDQAMPGVDMQWTEVSADRAMIEHMFALYFCWEYPIFQTLSKEHFLSDFKAGTHRYCSNLLVNALLALGCRLSVQQHSQSGSDLEPIAASRFFAEAKRLLTHKNTPLLQAVQALGLMSLYEASCGRDSESWFFSCQSMQTAVEIGLHIEMPIHDQLTAIEQEVRTVTFWGAVSLHQAWSLTLGRLPSLSKDMARVPKCPVIESMENDPWIPYRDDRIAQENSFEQASNVRTIHRCLCELSEIIHDSLYELYTPSGNLSGTSLLAFYRHYLAWKASLPEPCQLSAIPLPAVLYLHMYYHFALIMLFRPFIKLRLLGSAVSPLDVCIQAANAISSLIQTYKTTYSLRQTPVFVPYMLLASTITHLAAVCSVPAAPSLGGFSPIVLPELGELQALSSRYPFYRRAISIIRFLARQWNISESHFVVPMNRAGDGGGGVSGLNDDDDVFCLPIPGTMNFFCPNLEVLASNSRERIDITLFRPFPMQGMPLLSGSLAGVEKMGFQVMR